jgi:hypothetical protein
MISFGKQAVAALGSGALLPYPAVLKKTVQHKIS